MHYNLKPDGSCQGCAMGCMDYLLILVARAAKCIVLVNDILVGVRGVANQA
ncbi:hypothetical protein L5M18_21525 [Shewanella sp. SM20]|uniref:hypothetical protein n=1 Tax=Shewanella sp. SM20 TaxID=2912792 RepID=UPI0021D8CAAC|nr:hypothetical protein [Shewanella sp. SM20]MCU8094101.1 hypothetical protein [Shewanella sp. SM20]